MNRYVHKCAGCAYVWADHYQYLYCPWCGGACTNDLHEDEKDTDKQTE